LQQDDKDDVRQIGPDTEDSEETPIDEHRNRRPVLVVRLPQAELMVTEDPAIDEQRPFVRPEPLVAVFPKEKSERGDERDPVQWNSEWCDVTLLASAPQGSEHTGSAH
jgi:hypothetical protein